MTYIQRGIINSVVNALDDMPVVAITGMRQTGKSTFLQRQPEFRDRRYVTLDDFSQLAAAKENPDALVAGKEPLTIDEAQRCPELLVAIKRAVDRDRVPGGQRRDLAGLKAFVASTPRCAAGILAYNGTAPVPLGDRLWAIPLGLLLS
jgi:hypothetical protein